MKKTILSLNCGSSSLKFNIFNINDDMTVSPILNGIAEEIGNIRRSSMRFSHNGDKTKYPISLETHEDALSEMFEVFTRNGVQKESICAVGHRIVHGGPIYTKSTLINEEVKEQIKTDYQKLQKILGSNGASDKAAKLMVKRLAHQLNVEC